MAYSIGYEATSLPFLAASTSWASIAAPNSSRWLTAAESPGSGDDASPARWRRSGFELSTRGDGTHVRYRQRPHRSLRCRHVGRAEPVKPDETLRVRI